VKQENNIRRGNHLEKPVWRLITIVAEERLGRPEHHRTLDRSIRESLMIRPPASHGYWELNWYKPNPNEKGNRPDFTIYGNRELLLAIECKNLNPKTYHPSITWIKDRVISRLPDEARTKLLYISRLLPLPKDREKVTQALKDHNITPVELGRHLRQRDPHAFQYVNRDLRRYLEEVLQEKQE
jgi:hypothetical protein